MPDCATARDDADHFAAAYAFDEGDAE